MNAELRKTVAERMRRAARAVRGAEAAMLKNPTSDRHERAYLQALALFRALEQDYERALLAPEEPTACPVCGHTPEALDRALGRASTIMRPFRGQGG